jgi:hypothetical protein
MDRKSSLICTLMLSLSASFTAILPLAQGQHWYVDIQDANCLRAPADL